MKKGLPCNETRFTNGKDRNRIIYRFVTDDPNTPSSCTIRCGDTDPQTGEAITDMSFFREYYRTVDHEVYTNLKTLRPAYTPEQKAWREQKAQAFILDFEQKHGYLPSRDDIRYYLEQIEPERYNLYLDGITGEDGEPVTEFGKEFMCPAADPFGTDLPDDICALREIAAGLTGRLKAVYEAMLQKAADGSDRITYTEIAKIWGVSYNQIMKDTKKIEKMIREKINFPV